MELTGFSLSVLAAAGGAGFLHTLLGTDHHLPFNVLARTRSRSRTRTIVVTAAALAGATRLRFGRLERWPRTLAGSVIAASGLAILFLGP